jgi:aryl-alcohol dehydrogenase
MDCSTAKAALLTDGGDSVFQFRELSLSPLEEGEILVRIEASGVCHTDLVLMDMVERPCVLGHEGTGIVEAVADGVAGIVPGDCVILGYASCGACDSCRRAQPNLCERNFELSFSGCRECGGTTASLDGGPVRASIFQQSSFSTRVIARARNAVRVSPEIPPEVRASLTCSVFTGAGVVARQLRLRRGDSLLVFGAGVVGLSAAMAGAASEVEVVVVDPIESRRNMALELGAARTIDPTAPDFRDQVLAFHPGGFRYILDTSGASSVWAEAVSLLSMGGQFLFVTVPQPHDEASIAAFELMKRGGSAVAVIQGGAVPSEFIPQLIDWHQQGCFPIDRLIKCYPFEEINDATRDLSLHRVIKPVLLMSEKGD